MKRRTFLKTGAAAGAGMAVAPRRLEAETTPRPWRKFEVVTRLEVAQAGGVTRAWVPVPLMADTEYLKRQGDTWTGNFVTAKVLTDEKYGAGFVYAEWRTGETAPILEVTSRFTTRDRVVDVNWPFAGRAEEDEKVLALYRGPTKLIPLDGIVRETALEITKGLVSDLAKARAIYEWIVENTFRDPAIRGCGLGDVATMLKTRSFGGKCADLNGLFVGLARAADIPAREVYGIRVADSAEFKSLGRSGDISWAQHCRAEFYLTGLGWVPVDPADVRKVVLEEPPSGFPLDDPRVQRARSKLFGAWEMNWLAYNYAHDVVLPQSAGEPLPFLMYPQAETAGGRRDSLEPPTFRYQITAKEL
jgi:transglutaminase-like putative cysteine protease